ncbi:disulfide bond formation protein B [uncultured Thiodictyon sp.]|uniref:disulfide bond formation protein B n=1 Tax=uncultured Thiodictyon sp. TaxID=1846217 RepID=UPI0025E9C717|nr:disulfide bond formation protein B [uncultured Thiodictyon sp.]
MPASVWVVRLNVLALVLISTALVAAFVDQLVFGELPCPLCLLQRAALGAAGLGFLLNVRFGVRPLHYGLAIMAALVGAAVAMRQVLLHIAPGDPGFGSPLLGLHYYTWAFITFVGIIVGVAVLLSLPNSTDGAAARRRHGWLAGMVLVVFTLLIAANLVSTLLECGISQCPDDPVGYEWIGKISAWLNRGGS